MTKTAPKRTFSTHDGVELEFRPVSSWTIQHLNMKWEREKPLPPIITTYLGDDTSRPMQEYNPYDEKYKHCLSLWEAERATNINETAVKMGVTSEPPAEFVTLYQEMFPDIPVANIKVHWVYSLLNADEIATFFEMVLGQTAVTEAGLKEAAATFPSQD